jgi:mRNA interferase MazF
MDDKYIKDFDNWNIKAKFLDSRSFDDYFYAREIWWAALGINIGSEQDGKNESFERPILVLKRINKDLCLVVPFTSKILNNDYRITTESTGIQAQVVLSQIKVISSKRLLRKVGKIKTVIFFEILIKLSFIILGIIKDETPP